MDRFYSQPQREWELESSGFYADDLAYIHDVHAGGFARKSIPGLLRQLRRHGLVGGLVVDLGCGTGIWARALIDAGYDVLGIDVSASMINLARKRSPEARYQRDSLHTCPLPPCQAVTSLGECLGYFSDQRLSDRSLLPLFERIHGALDPDGIFVFDLLRADGPQPELPRAMHWEGKDWAILLQTTVDNRTKTLTRRMTTFRKVGARYRRGGEIHQVKLFDSQKVIAGLQRSGFRVQLLRGYGTFRFRTGHVGFLAKKLGALIR